jgi:hypothetical protein
MTDEALRARIAREGGVAADDSPATVAKKVRDWVAATVVFGEEPHNVEVTTNVVMTEPAWQPYVDFFQPRRGGVWCAGIARAYQKALALFGIPSVTLDVGWEHTELTHVTTLVVVRDRGVRRYYVFDPTFDASYIAPDGSDVDITSALEGRRASFTMRPMTRIVLTPPSLAAHFSEPAVSAGVTASCVPSSTIRDVAECRVENHNRFNMATMQRALARHGGAASGDLLLTLMRHRVIAVHGSELDPGAVDDLRAQCARAGVTIPQAG